MPRARIRDEDRQRARKACIPCKESKIRCDANLPCSNCIRRSCRQSCQYLEVPSARREQDHNPPTHRILKARAQPSSLSRQVRDVAQSPIAPDSERITADHPADDVTHDADLPTGSAEATHSRMLLSSKGEKVYVGKIASLSLLQFLRQTVKLYAGPCPFSETASKNVMLEAEVPESVHANNGGEDILHKQALIQYFFKTSSGLLDLYSENDIFNSLSRSIHASDEYSLSTDERAALCLIIAIGGQCRGQQHLDLQYATTGFTQGRTLAFEGMLSDPSVDMVRVFLLLTFYMLGACRRNAAFMYLGVASKAACALGLHSKSHYSNLSGSERTLRERTWKSLYVMDTLVNSILGRPSTLPAMESKTVEGQGGGRNVQNKNHSLDAAFGVCVHIATVVPRISRGTGTGADFAFTETFLETLGRWGENVLPSTRKVASIQTLSPDSADSSTVIGNTHAACIYYFAIIMITRPFLLSHLTYKLRIRVTSSKEKATANKRKGDNDNDDPRIPKLAQVCVDAATYMTHLCQKAMHSHALANNMCILKALVFAAGLLLGFTYFVDGKGPTEEVEEVFHAAQATLHHFSALSPQARHYCEILRDFERVIIDYHQSLLAQRRRSTNPYVRQVFSIEVDGQPPRWDGMSVPGPTRALFTTSNDGAPPATQSNPFHIVNPAGVGSGVGSGAGVSRTDRAAIGHSDLYPGSDSSPADDSMTGYLPIDDAMSMPLLWDNFDIDWRQFDTPSVDFSPDI